MSTDPAPSQPQTARSMSVEEYLQLNRHAFSKYEYLDGVARLMSGGSGEHAEIANNVWAALKQHFLRGPCFARGSDMQVLVGIKSSGKEHYLYPDVSVSCDVADRRRGNMLIRSPRLMVEVLSPTTEVFDRGPKLQAYQACPTIQEIVLISQFVPFVEVHRRQQEEGETWSMTSYSSDHTSIELISLDVQLAMAEIYNGIDFNEPLIER